MSASRTERLLNLLMALLNTQTGLRRNELRHSVYRQSSANEATFGRMFERDKNELRHFGFDVETVTDRGWHHDDPATTRYRIGKNSNTLPDLHLTPEEWAVLRLSAQVWERASLGPAAAGAVRKVQASAAMTEQASGALLQPRIKPAGQSFDELVRAMHLRRPVSFGYAAQGSGHEKTRTVEPWGVGSRFGHWYLAGFDRDRQDLRFFRLSRLTTGVNLLATGTFDPPSDFNISVALAAFPELPQQEAILGMRPGTLQQLRRRARDAKDPQPDAKEIDDVGQAGLLSDRVAVPFSDIDVLAEELASYGPQVRVEAPRELRDAVLQRLRRAAEFSAAPGPSQAITSAGSSAGQAHGAEDQLRRMLELVPFLVHNQGLHITEVAQRFGVSRVQLETDLRILICTGLPEGYPDDLFDIQWEDDHVFITQDLDLTRPIRFTAEEATALLAGVRILDGMPAVAEQQTLDALLLKLTAAAGDAGLRDGTLSAPAVAPVEMAALNTLQAALADGEQVRISYFSAHRDASTERFIDPLRLFSQDSTWYVEAWCHSAEGRRNFRLDRMTELRRTGKAATHVAEDPGVPLQLFTPSATDDVVLVELTERGRALAEDYYAQNRTELDGGGVLAEIHFGYAGWPAMFVAQHGGLARILEPEDIREQSLAWLEAAIDLYAG
ncbi:WYL domain-containing protein [Pseudarthrobacter sp. PS3-L1]|uniref:helix-turn-helix transcriptional regulator n=1 Tax=Pseudarthrobacter sp. PS3-L1 TaxID=3046207 RepID=UPI0024BA7678|nr:WYL domain-containing protein [Pseudarthrobacter sp. PS3-L1]MDJ0320147.1 WYL domain-containing protein [Pseudarthrobacter sp. PS3-L1]